MKLRYMHLLVSFLVPVLLYIQTVSFGFTDFDDNKLIKDNTAFLSDIGNISEAFGTDAFITGTSHFYRPLQVLSYMTDIWISGGINPWIFHLTNVILLGFVTCLLFVFLSQFGLSAGYVLLLTLLFISHPLFVPAVAWIPARGELLLTLFALVAFLTLHKYSVSGKVLYLFMHVCAFILALFSKETAALLPVLFIMYFLIKRKTTLGKRICLTLIAIYLVAGLSWWLIRIRVIDDMPAGNQSISIFGDEIVGVTPFLMNIRTIPAAISRFILPFNLDLIPSFSLFCDFTGTAILFLAGILIVKDNRMTRAEKLLCVLWFLFMLLPPMLYKHKLIDYLDHRFLFPLMGILPAVLMIQPRLQIFKKFGSYGSIIMIALIISMSLLTFFRSRAYSDPLKFYTTAVRQNPASPIAHNNLGAIFHNQGNYEKAIKEYTDAIRLKKDYLNAYNNRANAFLLAKSYRNAIEDYSRVISLDHGDANSYNNRGVAFINTGFAHDACNDFRTAYELGSQSAKINLERFCSKIRQ